MTDVTHLRGKYLTALRLAESHEKIHPAWQDDTNKGFLICYELQLAFADNTTLSITPTEVELPRRYPALGLMLSETTATTLSEMFEIPELPARIEQVTHIDYLLEGTTNQIELVLLNGRKLIIRHVFPPMTLGVKLTNV